MRSVSGHYSSKKHKGPIGSNDSGEPSRGPRKERDPNWNRMETLAFVRAIRSEFLEEIDADDPRVLMTTEGTKWEKIAVSVNLADGVTCYRSSDGCKYK